MNFERIYFNILFPIIAIIVGLLGSWSSPEQWMLYVVIIVISIIASACVYFSSDYEKLKQDYKIQKNEINRFNEKLKIYERLNRLEVKFDLKSRKGKNEY